MEHAIRMPKIGLTMTEGEVVSWAVSEGDRVSAGQAVLTISTEKTEQEVESPVDGVLVKKMAEQGDEIPTGEILGIIETD